MTEAVCVLLLDPAGAAGCLRVASDAVRALDQPDVTVLHVRCDPAAGVMPSEEVLPAERYEALARQAATDAAAIHAAYLAWQDPTRPSRWEQVEGVPAQVVAARGKMALLVATLPPPHAPLIERAALEAAIFTKGQPVLAVPLTWSGGFGRNLAVGWRDTASARRALQAARPWLSRAERVSIISVGTGDTSWPDQAMLDLPASRVSYRSVDPKGREEGVALLAAIAEEGADGLVMGAYRRSRLVEWALGGVTRQLLHQGALPLLMVH
jgi:nucleotide-binding universal stress UspA family protein